MLNERLRSLRESAGLTQLEASEQLGGIGVVVTRAAVGAWESGVARPTTERLRALATIYGLDDAQELELYRLAAEFAAPSPEAA